MVGKNCDLDVAGSDSLAYVSGQRGELNSVPTTRIQVH